MVSYCHDLFDLKKKHKLGCSHAIRQEGPVVAYGRGNVCVATDPAANPVWERRAWKRWATEGPGHGDLGPFPWVLRGGGALIPWGSEPLVEESYSMGI